MAGRPVRAFDRRRGYSIFLWRPGVIVMGGRVNLFSVTFSRPWPAAGFFFITKQTSRRRQTDNQPSPRLQQHRRVTWRQVLLRRTLYIYDGAGQEGNHRSAHSLDPTSSETPARWDKNLFLFFFLFLLVGCSSFSMISKVMQVAHHHSPILSYRMFDFRSFVSGQYLKAPFWRDVQSLTGNDDDGNHDRHYLYRRTPSDEGRRRVDYYLYLGDWQWTIRRHGDGMLAQTALESAFYCCSPRHLTGRAGEASF